MRPRPETAYQRKMSVCLSVCLSHHILIWVALHTCFFISQVNSCELSNNKNFSLLSCIMTSRCGLLNLGAGTSCFLNAILQCLFSCPMPLPRETQEDSFVREFCALASRLRVQTGPLDASNIYYGLPEVYRPGQQDASEVFHYFISVCPLLETFFTAIRTQTQNYSQCRPSNVQTTTFTSCDLHVKETTHAMGPVSLEELILDSTAAEIAIRCQVCLQIHGQQILQTESIASGLVLSLVGNLPRRRVHYPSALDFPIRDGVVELILVGVVRHVGESPREGHYFAVVQDFEDSSCWLCDDSVVSKTTQRVLLGECTGHPVLLFYIRKEVLEASHKRKLETKRTSDRLRQRARRAAKPTEAAEKYRAANAEAMRSHRAALPEADRQEVCARHRTSYYVDLYFSFFYTLFFLQLGRFLSSGKMNQKC